MSEETTPKHVPAAGGRPPAQDFSVDVRERGRGADGAPVYLETRLFMQLLAFHVDEGETDEVAGELAEAFRAARVAAVIYRDVNDPRGIALLTFAEDPAHFIERVAPVTVVFEELVLRPELTMLGRTYSTGFEQDLPFWMLERPRATALNPAWPWAVWYPLRRKGEFNRLPDREKGAILMEHGVIGRAYGEKDLAHDIRLACHGLDANDNEFVIGLIGKELHPLSHVVQSMRGTRQTSEYIEAMGPFFVGRVAHQIDPEKP